MTVGWGMTQTMSSNERTHGPLWSWQPHPLQAMGTRATEVQCQPPYQCPYSSTFGDSRCGHHTQHCSLLWECFWWPEMANQVQKSLKSCMHCLQHEGTLSQVPLHSIVSTAQMDLLHIDFTSIKTTMDINRLPKFSNALVFQDQFTKHVMAHMTPDQTAKTVIKF